MSSSEFLPISMPNSSAIPLEDCKYRWCGKFTSPNADWIHMSRNLLDYELMVVTEGTLYIGNHEQDFCVTEGEYLLMAPTVFQHGTQSSHCVFYWVHFDFKDPISEPFVTSESSHPNLLPIYGKLPSLDRIKIMMKQLQDSDRRYHNGQLNDALCSAILAEIYCQTISNSLTSFVSADGHEHLSKEQLLEEIATYIQWHVQENLLVSQIADYFGYNEKYLTTLFKKHHGISLKQYQLQTKMEHAKASLSETNLSVSHIAYSLGFADAHNFSNAFHKVTGLSPSEYRATYSKQNIFQV